MSYSPPRKLLRSDITDGFCSGAAELDSWLDRYAFVNQRANNAVTYVSTDGDRVVGYYSIVVAAVELAHVPDRLTKGGRPAELPCILLARLAVDESASGRGLGVGLLQDSLKRAAVISESIGAAAFLIHARDEEARKFYLHHGNFLDSPTDPLHLFLPMKDVRREFLST
ncbi:GNAT family N-acetyltransferase [Dietzia sp. E1]|uniref:GNAT family N-acetyltransferase n=1 Tax=Dietzia sp. E1 TaxID=328361 RepID=UPI00321FD39D